MFQPPVLPTYGIQYTPYLPVFYTPLLGCRLVWPLCFLSKAPAQVLPWLVSVFSGYQPLPVSVFGACHARACSLMVFLLPPPHHWVKGRRSYSRSCEDIFLLQSWITLIHESDARQSSASLFSSISVHCGEHSYFDLYGFCLILWSCSYPGWCCLMYLLQSCT